MTPATDEAAIQVDTYLDELLAARARHVAAAPDVPAELERTARLMREALVRFHPSFRFEEDLAARLRAVAAGALRGGALVSLPVPGTVLAPAAALPEAASGTPGAGAPPAHERGRVLLGGAIASGVSVASGLSLAAGMLLARRRRGRWERLV